MRSKALTTNSETAATRRGFIGLAAYAIGAVAAAKAALYFAHFRRMPWRLVDPSKVLGREFSSASGWTENVDEPLRQAGIELPGKSMSASDC